mmetsp:Transcript_14599/g.35684  ORF Transcript_14599/g.35684 Transcript_14599/m.35684 type:complete len:224 (-) Transcript_14599:59-730(-)
MLPVAAACRADTRARAAAPTVAASRRASHGGLTTAGGAFIFVEDGGRKCIPSTAARGASPRARAPTTTITSAPLSLLAPVYAGDAARAKERTQVAASAISSAAVELAAPACWLDLLLVSCAPLGSTTTVLAAAGISCASAPNAGRRSVSKKASAATHAVIAPSWSSTAAPESADSDDTAASAAESARPTAAAGWYVRAMKRRCGGGGGAPSLTSPPPLVTARP